MDPPSDKAELMNRKVPLDMLIKAQEEPKVTKEEEMTVILQVNLGHWQHSKKVVSIFIEKIISQKS